MDETVKIEIMNHGIDIFYFKMSGGTVKRLDRFGNQHEHRSLEVAMQNIYATPQILPQEFALLVKSGGISLDNAKLVFNRLVSEQAQGFVGFEVEEPATKSEWLHCFEAALARGLSHEDQ